ncbi:MAG TPA: hypothetical protein VGP04_01665 [Pseudonocardiaceae bacterium]|nr:hypothetical protein [Pseudonocardiaceae bacterium]
MLEEVLAREPDAVIPWTGRQMAVAKFVPHLRNEFVIHRWDFVGDDQVSAELLAQPELTEHAVDVLGQLLLRRGREHDPCPDEDFHVRLRTENAPDVRLVVEAGQAGLELVSDQTDEPHVNLDPAARTLVIWGRRPINEAVCAATSARPRSAGFTSCCPATDRPQAPGTPAINFTDGHQVAPRLARSAQWSRTVPMATQRKANR